MFGNRNTDDEQLLMARSKQLQQQRLAARQSVKEAQRKLTDWRLLSFCITALLAVTALPAWLWQGSMQYQECGIIRGSWAVIIDQTTACPTIEAKLVPSWHKSNASFTPIPWQEIIVIKRGPWQGLGLWLFVPMLFAIRALLLWPAKVRLNWARRRELRVGQSNDYLI